MQIDTKINTPVAVNFRLVDSNGAPVNAVTWAAGDVTVLKPGSSTWVNAAGANPALTTNAMSLGDWQYTPTAGEVDTRGTVIFRFYKAGVFVATRASVKVENALMGEAVVLADGSVTSAKFGANALLAQPVASVAGNVGGNVAGSTASVTGSVGGNVVGSVGSVAGNVSGNVVGSVGSVTGAVGSVAGNVGGSIAGNVSGSVGSVVGSIGGSIAGNVGGNVIGTVASVTAPVTVGTINPDVVSAAAVSAGAASKIGATVPAAPTAAAIATQVDSTLSGTHGSGSWLTGSGGASAAAIADAVWDEDRASHATAGSFGAALQQIVPTAGEVVSALFAAVVESVSTPTPASYTVQSLLQRIHAFIAGNGSVPGATDGTYQFRGLDNVTVRISATIASAVRTITGRG